MFASLSLDYIICLYYFHKLKSYTLQTKKILNSRSSHQRCSIEKAVFKNFAIFTGKHLCWSLLLIDLQVLKPLNLLKGECCKIFKNTILMKICEQLLLQFLLLTGNISCWVLVSALNSIGFLQRSSSSFKKFSLVCLVVGSSFIWKGKKH